MIISVKRVYDTPTNDDGFRILVDHLWPRGLKKEQARIDEWLKEISPSTELRKWFGHDPKKWDEFKRRYFAELDRVPETVIKALSRTKEGAVTLLYSSREANFNNAVALREYLIIKSGP